MTGKDGSARHFDHVAHGRCVTIALDKATSRVDAVGTAVFGTADDALGFVDTELIA